MKFAILSSESLEIKKNCSHSPWVKKSQNYCSFYVRHNFLRFTLFVIGAVDKLNNIMAEIYRAIDILKSVTISFEKSLRQ